MISSRAPPQPQETTTSKKSSETGRKPGRKTNPLDIPLKDFSPEVRKMLVAGMVKGGRAKVVKRSKPKK